LFAIGVPKPVTSPKAVLGAIEVCGLSPGIVTPINKESYLSLLLLY